MSMLGKVLAILNVLAALLFVYLAAVDWGKHQALSYAVFRNELVFNGLPVDEEEGGSHVPPVRLASHMGTQTLNEIYAGASGGELSGEFVKTQEAEVARVRSRMRQKIESLDGDPLKRAYLKNVLLALARNAAERSYSAQRADDSKVSVSELSADLDKWFSEALTARVLEAEAYQDAYDAKRQAIAHLLYNLSPESAWHDRVRAVVGLIEYAREAESQAAALEEMTRQVELAMADEQTTFERAYASWVLRLRYLGDQIDQLQHDLKIQKDLAEAHRVLVKSREADVKDFTTRVATAQSNLRMALDKQRGIEKKLFETRKDLDDKVRENLELEKQIRDLELGEQP